MHPLTRFQDELDSLVETVYRVHNGYSLLTNDSWCIALYDLISPFKKHSNYVLLREDISSQLILMWLSFIERRKENRPHMSLKSYLMMRSIWGLRDWYKKEIRAVDRAPPQDVDLVIDFKLDLSWLIHNVAEYPLSALTAFERYLIFLKFTYGFSIIEISKATHKDRHVVSKQLDATLNKLRSLYNETSNTE